MTIVTRWRAPLALALPFILPFLLLWPFRSAGFVADDFYFARTPFSMAAGDLAANREWRHDIARDVRGYRPLATASYAIDQRVADGGPTTFRLTNFALHGVASSLVGALGAAVAGSTMVGLVAGVLFAVHPVHHENVLWISGRTFPLAAIFYLAALVLVARRCAAAADTPRLAASTSTGREPARRLAEIAGGIFFTICALSSYEGAVTLPLAVFVLALACGKGSAGSGRIGGAVRVVLPYLAVTMAYLAMRWLWISSASSEASAYGGERAVRNGLAVVGRLLAMPRLEHTPIVSSATLWASAIVAALTIGAGLLSGASRRIVSWALAFAVVAYLPFIALPGYSDRFVYLSSAGFVIAVAAGGWELWQRPGARRAAAAIGVSLVATLWSAQLVRAGGQWMEAGSIATRFTTEIQRALPDPPAGARLGFLCVPEFYGTAYIYYTYFELEMKRALRRPDLAITRFPRTPDGATPAGVDPSSSNETEVDYLFRWLDRDRRLETIRQPGDPAGRAGADAVTCQAAPLVIKP